MSPSLPQKVVVLLESGLGPGSLPLVGPPEPSGVPSARAPARVPARAPCCLRLPEPPRARAWSKSSRPSALLSAPLLRSLTTDKTLGGAGRCARSAHDAWKQPRAGRGRAVAAGGMGSPAPGRQQPEVLGERSEGGACWYRPPLGAPPARHPRVEVPAPSARTPCCSRRTLSPSWCHRAWREGAVKQVGASLSDPGTARGVRRAWGSGGCDGPPGAARARALGGKLRGLCRSLGGPWHHWHPVPPEP